MGEAAEQRRRATDNIQKETIVVSTEDGIVLTGSRLEGFENRIVSSIRKPFFAFLVLMMIQFVIMAGGAIVVSNMGNTVDNTDRLVVNATGEEAQKAQAETVQRLLDAMNCNNQLNNQRTLKVLFEGRLPQDKLEDLVDASCRPRSAETTTTTEKP